MAKPEVPPTGQHPRHDAGHDPARDPGRDPGYDAGYEPGFDRGADALHGRETGGAVHGREHGRETGRERYDEPTDRAAGTEVAAPAGVEPPGQPVPPSPVPPSPVPSSKAVVGPTRTSGTWIAVIVATLVLILLLVFILQNLDNVTVSFLGFAGTLPLGVAMLFAAIAGALLVALVGAARIMQLRRRVRRIDHPRGHHGLLGRRGRRADRQEPAATA